MTDDGRARGRGNPDAPSPPDPAGVDDDHRQVADPAAGLVGPLARAAGSPEPEPTAGGQVADEIHAAVSDGQVGGRDGGVTTRLARRCLAAAAILIGVAALCLLLVALRDWDVPSALLALVALPAIAGGVILWRRRALWTSVSRAVLGTGLGMNATTGDPRPLSPSRNGSPFKRRLGALVLPLRADSGPTPGDGALIVHTRADGVAPAAGDRLRVVPIARGGDPVAAGTDPRTAIRVLLVRDSDGTVFVATTRVTDTW